MKNVFSNNHEICHVFAQRSQDSGKGGSIFFEKDTIYSYGYHFPMAKFIETKKGLRVLFTTKTYSVTTAKHLSIAYGALSQYEIFHVPNLDLDHTENIESYRKRLLELSIKTVTSRKYSNEYLNRYTELIEEASLYADFFGLKTRFNNDINKEQIKKLIDKQSKQKREAQKRKKEVEKQNLEKWFNNEFDGYFHNLANQFLRLKDSETVQTTKGAEFPLSHCSLLYKKIKECRENKTSWHRNGSELRAGVFHIDSIDTEGNVRAGCHNITFEEIERFATLNNIN